MDILNYNNKKAALTPKQAMEEARYIAVLVKAGRYTYDEGKVLALPYLKIVNDAGKKIAKEYGQKYKPIGWTGILR